MSLQYNKKRSKNFYFLSMLVIMLSVLVTYPFLPQQIVSTSFNLMGSGANSTKITFLIVQLIFLVVYTLIGYGVADFFIRVAPSGINIPNKEYWLHPSRMNATINKVSAMVYWILSYTNILIGIILVRIYIEQIARVEISATFFPILIILYLFVIVSFIMKTNKDFKRQVDR